MSDLNLPELGTAVPFIKEPAYRYVSLLGTGRSGVVYRAEPSDGSQAPSLAIKLPRPGLSDDLVERLRQEGMFLRQFRYWLAPTIAANCVPQVYGEVTSTGPVFLATDLVTSPSVDQILENGALDDEPQLAKLGQQLLTLLDMLHRHERTYLDFKLENLHWDADMRQLVVIDWNEVGTKESDPNGAQRDLLRAMVYLHGVATGVVLPIRGDQVAAPYDRSSRWGRLSPFLQLIFRSSFRSDVVGRYQSAGEIARDWARLERLWTDLTPAHADTIVEHWTDLSQQETSGKLWRALLTEQAAAGTMRLAVQRTLPPDASGRGDLLEQLDELDQGLRSDLVRRDPTAVGRTFLEGNSLRDALAQFAVVSAYEPRAVRWLVAVQLLLRDSEATGRSPNQERTTGLIRALDDATEERWAAVVEEGRPLASEDPYCSIARQLVAEAQVRLGVQRAAALEPQGKYDDALATMRQAVEAAPRIEEAALRQLIERDIALSELGRNVQRLQRHLEERPERKAELNVLLADPTLETLVSAAKAADTAMAASGEDTELAQGLVNWVDYALTAGENNAALTFATAACALGAIGQAESLYQSALRRRNAESLAARGQFQAALDALRAIPRLDGRDDSWVTRAEHEWGDRLKAEVQTILDQLGEAVQRIQNLALAGDPVVPAEIAAVDGTILQVRRLTRVPPDRLVELEGRLSQARGEWETGAPERRRKALENSYHRTIAAVDKAIRRATLVDWRDALGMLRSLDEDALGRIFITGAARPADLVHGLKKELTEVIERAEGLAKDLEDCRAARRHDAGLDAIARLRREKVGPPLTREGTEVALAALSGLGKPNDLVLSEAAIKVDQRFREEANIVHSLLDDCRRAADGALPASEASRLRGKATTLSPTTLEIIEHAITPLIGRVQAASGKPSTIGLLSELGDAGSARDWLANVYHIPETDDSFEQLAKQARLVDLYLRFHDMSEAWRTRGSMENRYSVNVHELSQYIRRTWFLLTEFLGVLDRNEAIVADLLSLFRSAIVGVQDGLDRVPTASGTLGQQTRDSLNDARFRCRDIMTRLDQLRPTSTVTTSGVSHWNPQQFSPTRTS